MATLTQEEFLEKYGHTKWYKRWGQDPEIFDWDNKWSLVYDFENDEPLEFPILAIENQLVWTWKRDLSSIYTPSWPEVSAGKDNPRGKITKIPGTDWSYFVYDYFNYDMVSTAAGLHPGGTYPWQKGETGETFALLALASLPHLLRISGKQVENKDGSILAPDSPHAELLAKVNRGITDNSFTNDKDSIIQFGSYDIEVRGDRDVAKSVGPGLRFLIGIKTSALEEAPENPKLLGGSPKKVDMESIDLSKSIVVRIEDIDTHFDAIADLFKFYHKWREQEELSFTIKPKEISFSDEAEKITQFKSTLKELIADSSNKVKAFSTKSILKRKKDAGLEGASSVEGSLAPSTRMETKEEKGSAISFVDEEAAGAIIERIEEASKWGKPGNIIEIVLSNDWEMMYLIEYIPGNKFIVKNKAVSGGRTAIARYDKNGKISDSRVLLGAGGWGITDLEEFKEETSKRTVAYISQLHGFYDGFKEERFATFDKKQFETFPKDRSPQSFLKTYTKGTGAPKEFATKGNPLEALRAIRKTMDSSPVQSQAQIDTLKEAITSEDWGESYLSYLENWDTKVQDGWFSDLPDKPKRLRLHDWPNTFDDIYDHVLNQADVQALVIELIRCLAPQNWLYILCMKAMEYAGMPRIIEGLQKSGMLDVILEGNTALQNGLVSYEKAQAAKESEAAALEQEKREYDEEIEEWDELRKEKEDKGDTEAVKDIIHKINQLEGKRQLAELDQAYMGVSGVKLPLSEDDMEGLKELNSKMAEAIGNLKDPNLIDKICKNIIQMVKEILALLKELYAFFAGLPPSWRPKLQFLDLKWPDFQIDDIGKYLVELLRQMAAQAVAAAVLWVVKGLLKALIEACNNLQDWLMGDDGDEKVPGLGNLDDLLAENEDLASLVGAMRDSLDTPEGAEDLANMANDLLNLMGDLEILFSEVELCALFHGRPTQITTTIIRNLLLTKYDSLVAKLKESDSNYVTNSSVIELFSGFKNYIDDSYCTAATAVGETPHGSAYDLCLPIPSVENLKEDLLNGNATKDQIDKVIEQNKLDNEALLGWAIDMATTSGAVEPPPVFCGPDGPGLLKRGSVGPTKFLNGMVLEQIFEPIEMEFRGDFKYFIDKLTSKNTSGGPFGLALGDETDTMGNMLGKTSFSDTWEDNDNMSEAMSALTGRANRGGDKKAGFTDIPIMFSTYNSLRNDRAVRHFQPPMYNIIQEIVPNPKSHWNKLESFALDIENSRYYSPDQWKVMEMAPKYFPHVGDTQESFFIKNGEAVTAPVVVSFLPASGEMIPRSKYILQLNAMPTPRAKQGKGSGTEYLYQRDGHQYYYIYDNSPAIGNIDHDVCRYYGDLFQQDKYSALHKKFTNIINSSEDIEIPWIAMTSTLKWPGKQDTIKSINAQRFKKYIENLLLDEVHADGTNSVPYFTFGDAEKDNYETNVKNMASYMEGSWPMIMHDEIIWGSLRHLGESYFFHRRNDVKGFLYSLIPSKLFGIGEGCEPEPDGSILKVEGIKTKVQKRLEELECEQQPKMGHDPTTLGLSAAEGMVLTLARMYAIETSLRVLPALWEMKADHLLKSDAIIELVAMDMVKECIAVDNSDVVVSHTSLYKRHHRPKAVSLEYKKLKDFTGKEIESNILIPKGVYTENPPLPATPPKLRKGKIGEDVAWKMDEFHPKYQAHIVNMANKIVFRLAEGIEKGGSVDKDGNPDTLLVDPFDDPNSPDARTYRKEEFEVPYTLEGFKYLLKVEIQEVSKFFGEKFNNMAIPSHLTGEYPNFHQWWLKNAMHLEATDIYKPSTSRPGDNHAYYNGEYLGAGASYVFGWKSEDLHGFIANLPHEKKKIAEETAKIPGLKKLFEQDLHSNWMPRLYYGKGLDDGEGELFPEGSQNPDIYTGATEGDPRGLGFLTHNGSKRLSYGRFYAVAPARTFNMKKAHGGESQLKGGSEDADYNLYLKKSAYNLFGKRGSFILEPYIRITQKTDIDGNPMDFLSSDGFPFIKKAFATNHGNSATNYNFLEDTSKHYGGLATSPEGWLDVYTSQGAPMFAAAGLQTLDLTVGAYLNLTDFIERFANNKGLYDHLKSENNLDAKMSDFFESWEYGLRLVYVFPLQDSFDDQFKEAAVLENPVWNPHDTVPILPTPGGNTNDAGFFTLIDEYVERAIDHYIDITKLPQDGELPADPLFEDASPGTFTMAVTGPGFKHGLFWVENGVDPVRRHNILKNWPAAIQGDGTIIGYSDLRKKMKNAILQAYSSENADETATGEIAAATLKYRKWLEMFGTVESPTPNMKQTLINTSNYELLDEDDDLYESALKTPDDKDYQDYILKMAESVGTPDEEGQGTGEQIRAKNSYVIYEKIEHKTGGAFWRSPPIFCLPVAEVNTPVSLGDPKLLRYMDFGAPGTGVDIYGEYPKEDLLRDLEEKIKHFNMTSPGGKSKKGEKKNTPEYDKNTGLLDTVFDMEAAGAFMALCLISKSYEDEAFKDIFLATKKQIRRTFYTCMLAQKYNHDSDDWDLWEMFNLFCKAHPGPCGDENGGVWCQLVNMMGIAFPPDFGKLLSISPLVVLKMLVMLIDPTWCKLPWTIPGIIMYYLNKLNSWWDWDLWNNETKQCLPLPEPPAPPADNVTDEEKMKILVLGFLLKMLKGAGKITDESIEDVIFNFNDYKFKETILWDAIFDGIEQLGTTGENSAEEKLELVFERLTQFLMIRKKLVDVHKLVINELEEYGATPDSPACIDCGEVLNLPAEEKGKTWQKEHDFCLIKAQYQNMYSEFSDIINEFQDVFDAANVSYSAEDELADLTIDWSEWCEYPDAVENPDPDTPEVLWDGAAASACEVNWKALLGKAQPELKDTEGDGFIIFPDGTLHSFGTHAAQGQEIVINGTKMQQTYWVKKKCEAISGILDGKVLLAKKTVAETDAERYYRLICNFVFIIEELEAGAGTWTGILKKADDSPGLSSATIHVLVKYLWLPGLENYYDPS